VVISHLHADHVGGPRAMARRTFSFAAEAVEPRGVMAYVPTAMRHDRAEVRRTTGPRVVAPGVAVLPPLPRMLFWIGPVAEQALVVNVRGFGLVLLTGCGHPQIERILGVTEQALDVPLVPQAVLGSPKWPWQLIGERDVEHVLDEIDARGPRVVALSSHDSTPWTYGAFADRFGDRYRTLRAGEELRIAAAKPG
jgi:7,8-dihydropterin-6-yl-methyl-4-(beta-D-ribofuranosyl)aminobenzene 5'-phosphate synthase